MKKRSLVAALAMLMVSAIVLTSSTYAWFATGTTAKVSTISATITNTDGSISLSASENEGYKIALTKDDFTAVGNGSFATQFTPVSFDPTANTFMSGSIKQDTDSESDTYEKMIFTPTAASTSSYTSYTVYVKSTVDCTISVTPNFGGTNVAYTYAAVSSDGMDTFDVFAANAREYYPLLKSAVGSAGAIDGIDANNNKIMDSNDTLTNGLDKYGHIATTPVEATNTGISLTLTANEPTALNVYIWAEGQDLSCNTSVSGGAIEFGLDFAITSTENNG